MYHVFTDGGARGNGKGVSAWAFAVYDGWEEYVGSKSEGFSKTLGYTNNYTELLAVIKALKWAKKADTTVRICTDSNYVNQGINQWMANWIKNHWRTSQNRPVKNVELWRELYHLHKEVKHQVTIEHVPGHAHGLHLEAVGNRQADTLCNMRMDEKEFEEEIMI